MKLNRQQLSRLGGAVALPAYNPDMIRTGIAHIGVGGFHRAHQAVYTDALMNQGLALDWGICGVGVRSEDRAMRDTLADFHRPASLSGTFLAQLVKSPGMSNPVPILGHFRVRLTRHGAGAG